MATKRLLTIGAFAVVSLLCASNGYSQIVFGQAGTGNTGFAITNWKLDYGDSTHQIDQFWVPLSGFVPLGDNTEARVFLATANSDVTLAATDHKLAGLSDLRMQFSRSYVNDQYLVSAGVNLPTGKTQLQIIDAVPVLEILAQSFLEFPMRRYGEGFGFNVLLGTARRWGDGNIGLSARYEYLGSYKPYKAGDSLVVDDYKPGDVLNINLSGDWPTGSMVWSGAALFTVYGADKSGGIKTIKQSPELTLRLDNAYKATGYTLRFRAGYTFRGDNERFSDDPDIPGQKLKLYGDEFHFGASAIVPFAGTWYVVPSAAVKAIAGHESGSAGAVDFGSSTIWTLGAATGKQFGDQFVLEVGFLYGLGDADGGNIDVTGYQVNASIRAEF
jgi:hypothetical protein